MMSLPLLPPRADASLWPSHRIPTSIYDDASSTSPPGAGNNQPAAPRRNHHASPELAQLAAEERALEQRKENVRRFGAGWLRPSGITKTLQQMRDEEIEKEEQEAIARREQIMMDLAAAQQDAANAEERMRGEEEVDEDGENEEEHDLDDDVPEAEVSTDESVSGSSDEDASESGSEQYNDASISIISPEPRAESIPFNEDSFIEGSQLEAEVSAMLDAEEAEMAGVLQDERDLDDDVPEAGSYEHTDSELDDSDSEDGAPSFAQTPALRSSFHSHRDTGRSSRFSSARRSTRRSSGLPGSALPGSASVSTSRSHRAPPSVHAPARGIGRPIDLGPSLGNARSSFGFDGSSSIMEGSSFLRSSPAAPRVSLRDRFLGAARQAGRRG